jgi:hypothetical protein
VCRGVGKDQDVSGSLDHRDQVERGALSGEAARITLTAHAHPVPNLGHGDLDEFAETSNSFSQRIKVHSNQYDRSLV